MACNCNTVNPTCEPCAICTPPGVVGLTTCQPPDPCPDGSLDINCVIYNGSNFSCASVQNGDTLISVLLEILAKIFPPSFCCGLQGTANYSTCGLGGTISYFITTTTTSTSTTTSTTLVPVPCSFYQLTNTSQTGPSVVSYVPCNCTYRITQTVGTQPVTICVNNSFSLIVVSGSVSPSQQGPCSLPPCPTTTSTSTTTTSTSTSTTSTTSTTTTTTLCPCQNYTFTGGTGNPTSFNIVGCPGAIIQTLILGAGDPPVTRCINNAYPIITRGGNGTYTPGLCDCATTTTTTSTTSTTSTTTTTTVLPSQLCFSINITTPTTTTSTSTTSTTSSTTTSTTQLPIVGEIQIFAEQGVGTDLQVTAQVVSGNVGNNLVFNGFVQRYSDTSCTLVVGSPLPFTFTMFPAMTNVTQTGVGSTIGIQTTKIISLIVGSTAITTDPQIINISGNNYQIDGFNECVVL